MPYKEKQKQHDQNAKDVEDRLNALEIKNGIEEGISKWVKTVCITSTTATFSFLLWLGSISYDKLPAFKAAILAFIQTDKGLK